MSTEAMMSVEGGNLWSDIKAAISDLFSGIVDGWNSNIPQTN